MFGVLLSAVLFVSLFIRTLTFKLDSGKTKSSSQWATKTPSTGQTRPENVKCTLVQALRLSTGRTPHSGSRGIALLFLDHGTRRG